MKTILILFSIFLFVSSCVPQSSLTGRKINDEQTIDDDWFFDMPADDGTSLGDYHWYSAGIVVNGNIALDNDTNDSIFIRGEGIENWLSLRPDANYTSTYFDYNFCLISTFDDAGAKKQARYRAIPMTYRNPVTAELEKLLRIELVTSADNSTQCGGSLTLTLYNALISKDETSTVSSLDSAFDLSTVCPTCQIPITTDNLGLVFFPKNTTLTTFPLPGDQQLFFKDLSLLDLTIKAASAPSTGGSCSDSACQAFGKDCCLEGQCVINGAIRPGAANLSEYNQAINDFTLNTATYINWPQVFYVCSGSTAPVPTPTPEPTPDPGEQADEELAALTKQYNCLEGAKLTPPSYTACEPDFTESSFEDVRLDVWKTCGCEADYTITDPNNYDPRNPLLACPDFGLQVVEADLNDIPRKIECLVPDPNPVPTPFQELNLSVSARSVPHRFFQTDGKFVDDLSTVTVATLQESATSSPNGTFNINRIFGDMLVDLSKAQPAKTVNIEYGQSYIIRTKPGSYYTPCPACSDDSWYAGFTAFAQPFPIRGELFGNGLQASPTITNRSTSSISSLNKGNYEDTIWGRACWVPPTMLPSAHNENSDAQVQRRTRLETQSAMYMNGYRKDWFGFNQGALIGSFDGVKWFAIGSGRQVVSTSSKLFLAINAPFADLASLSAMSVEIITYLGPNSVAIYDYDPTLEEYDPRQNLAASCQSYHQCEVDSDCITQLGWEYMCAPISYHKSKWPEFDMHGNELNNKSITSEGFMEMIQNGVAPSGSNKRCVYRGAGAPCVQDIKALVSTDPANVEHDNTLRHLSCAPNFYCASVDSLFNDDINREPQLLGTIKYGQEADVMGRPKDYVGGRESLLAGIQSTLRANMKLYNSSYGSTNDAGLCRPGKAIMTDPFEAHGVGDIQKRTDFISQIGSCEPTKTGYLRVMSCPYLIEDVDIDVDPTDLTDDAKAGNYKFLSTATYSLVTDAPKLKQQNSCGQEALSETGKSPFELIEALRIPLITSLETKQLPINGCFRRAGSVCHTDLDCSPNELQSNTAISYDKTYFGDTTAEKEFWDQFLVCGQGAAIPSLTYLATSGYSLTKNRCCREIGKDFTMYTQIDNPSLLGNLNTYDSSIIYNNSVPTGLQTGKFTVNDPKATGRYSRYISSNPTYNTENRNGTTLPNVHSEVPAVLDTPLTTAASKTPHAFQWKTMHDTGKRTCCGRSFIRKFSDGGHDWIKRDRLRIDSLNFQCLNYQTNLYNVNEEVLPGKTFKSMMYSSSSVNFDKELSKMCLSAGVDGCIQRPFLEPSDAFSISAPVLVGIKSAIMSTTPVLEAEATSGYQITNHDVPYSPTPYAMEWPIPLQISGIDYEKPQNFVSSVNQQIIYFHLPIYINADNTNQDNIARVSIHYVCPGAQISETSATTVIPDLIRIFPLNYQADDPYGTGFTCDNLKNPLGTGFGETETGNDLEDEHYCITTDGIFFANADDDNVNAGSDNNNRELMCTVDGTAVDWAGAGIAIEFTPLNTRAHVYSDGLEYPELEALKGTDGSDEKYNPLYYLTKLGRMELLGIPQIYYEPIFCNSNHNELVNGLYATAVTSNTITIPNPNLTLPPTILMTFDNAATTGLFTYGETTNGTTSGQVASSLGKIYADSDADLNYYSTAEDDSNSDKYVLLQNMINPTHQTIFSAHEFACCTKLGEQESDYHNCCSGYGIQEGGNLTYTCLLPPGADLNVYFNRFVSGEGYADDLPESLKQYGFTDNDFVPETGEPKLQTKVYDKVSALGSAYCSLGSVRGGAAFGKFVSKPFAGYIYNAGSPDYNEDNNFYFSIIEQPDDFDQAAENGTLYFNVGFRWNHHLYCDFE